jgi:hypothetical protein
MIRFTRLAAVAAVALVASAHVGSPDTYYEGWAGPYHLRVIVRTPGVVPGLAQITVRLLDGGRAGTVTVLPVFWNPRTAAPPPPDTARIVSGDSAVYTAALWLMTRGSYGVQVAVAGARGTGTALVPVQAVSTRRLELQRPLAAGLAAFGLFLFAGLLTIIRAAWSEAILPPGEAPDARRSRRGWLAAGVAGAVALGALAGGRRWWNAVDQDFTGRIYRPVAAAATVRDDGGRAMLRFSVLDSFWRAQRISPLIPDHGHLVHLFLVREDLSAFAHLHSLLVDSSDFDAALPPLPAGRYRVYADLTHETGFTETLTDTIDIAPSAGVWRATDPDDAWTGTGDGGRETGDTTALSDGSRMAWSRGSAALLAGQDAPLRFTVTAPDGRPAALDPYMGMAGHLLLTRDDGSVFLHVHPLGTISWASQQTFLLRGPADTVRGAVGRRLTQAGQGAMPGMSASVPENVVSFPFAFPKPGRYHLWVQVKRAGRILTGQFTAEVQ